MNNGTQSDRISIVIPVYNQVHFTRLCLESLLPPLNEQDEVLVIDNASSDGTAGYLDSCDGIRYIINKENLGCSGAWNQGVRETSSDWIVFLNNDVIVPPGWLDALRDCAANRRLDIVSPAIREGEYNYNIIDFAEAFVSKMRCVERFGVADGICFMVKREVFEAIGSFDENFRIGQFEDTDFFRRARLAGMRLAITGSSILHHFGSVTQDSIRKKRTARPYETENRAYYRRKWKLTWWRRFLERRWIKIRGFWWRTTELLHHGYTLKIKWEHGRLRYY